MPNIINLRRKTNGPDKEGYWPACQKDSSGDNFFHACTAANLGYNLQETVRKCVSGGTNSLKAWIS